MKKIILFAMLAVAGITATNAQTTKKAKAAKVAKVEGAGMLLKLKLLTTELSLTMLMENVSLFLLTTELNH